MYVEIGDQIVLQAPVHAGGYHMARDDYGFGNVGIIIVAIARFAAVFGIFSFHVTARFAAQDADFVGEGLRCDGTIASDHDDLG